MTTQRVLLIDALNLIYRAYYAYPETMRTPDGQPVNAVYGVLRLLSQVATEFRPAGVIAAGERGPVWRSALLPAYKHGRGDRPDLLTAQLPVIARLLRLLGIPVVVAPDHEADDVLASLARRETVAGRPVLILSNDRDLWQLVRPGVAVVIPYASSDPSPGSRYRTIGRDDVLLAYGVEPALLPDYKALVGDTTDNYAGVTGIGPVAARSLITHYGDVDAILAAAPTMGPGKTRRLLLEQADQARRCKQLARLVDDLALPPVTARVWGDVPDRAALLALLDELGIRRVSSLVGG